MSATFEEISRDSVRLARSKRLALARFVHAAYITKPFLAAKNIL